MIAGDDDGDDDDDDHRTTRDREPQRRAREYRKETNRVVKQAHTREDTRQFGLVARLYYWQSVLPAELKWMSTDTF